MNRKRKREMKKAVRESQEFFAQFHRQEGPIEFTEDGYQYEVRHVNDKGEDLMDILLRSKP